MVKAKSARSSKQPRAQAAKPRRPKEEPLPWLDIVDELDDIRAMLRIVPELTAAIRFITDRRSGTEDNRDRLSRWAIQALGIDVDRTEDEERPTERFPCLEEMVLAPDALRDSARWRLWRLSRLIQAAIRADLLTA